MSRAARDSACVCLPAVILSLGGCVYEDGQAPPKPRPTALHIDEPAGLDIQHIVLSTDQFAVDTDGNGYADTFRVYVYLFPDETVYPKPIHERGTLLFSLTDQDGKAVAEWALPPDELLGAEDPTLPLKGYSTKLNLLDAGSDQFDINQADLTCRFIPEGGQAVRARGFTTVVIGPTARSLGR